jgi:hypothetical protein
LHFSLRTKVVTLLVALSCVATAQATLLGAPSNASSQRQVVHQSLSASVAPGGAGGLLLALISAREPATGGQTTTTPRSTGLTWTLVTSRGARGGFVSIWRARTSGTLGRVTVTAELGQPSSQALLTVVAFGPGATLEGHGTGVGTASFPKVTLDAPAGGQVWAVGHDAASGAPRKLFAGQRLVRQLLSEGQHQAAWVQEASARKAGRVTVGARGTTESWTLAAVTVRPAAVARTGAS